MTAPSLSREAQWECAPVFPHPRDRGPVGAGALSRGGIFSRPSGCVMSAGSRIGRRCSARRCSACPTCSFPSAGVLLPGSGSRSTRASGGYGTGSGRPDQPRSKTGRSFLSSRCWDWPSTCAGSSAPGRLTSPRSTRFFCSMRVSMHSFSMSTNLKESASICACAGVISPLAYVNFIFFLATGAGPGPGLRFLHLHPFDANIGAVSLKFAGAWIFTFFLIAVPEELFFRGWLQNLLERHIGRTRTAGSGNPVWPVSLQQARGALQLALCVAGRRRRRLLWTRVAPRPPGWGIRSHACHRRLSLVAVVSLTGRGWKEPPCPRRSDTRCRRACCDPPRREW